ncbi:MAG TPA: cytochrome c [Rhizomicrobium sp.]|jgi:mono/diheme cytochrome c family protein
MKKIAIATTCFLTVTAAAMAAPAFKPLSVELPPDVAVFPDGPNVAVVNRNCLACHSADMVLDQPLLPRATWVAEVTKMRNVYKAPVTDADAALIVDYLAATHSPP